MPTAALISWIATAAGRSVLAGTWLAHGGLRQRQTGVAPLPQGRGASRWCPKLRRPIDVARPRWWTYKPGPFTTRPQRCRRLAAWTATGDTRRAWRHDRLSRLTSRPVHVTDSG